MSKTIYRGVALLFVGLLSTSVSFAENTDTSSATTSGSDSGPIGDFNPLSGITDWVKNMFSKNPAQAAAEDKEATEPGLTEDNNNIMTGVTEMINAINAGNINITPDVRAKLHTASRQYEDNWENCVSRQQKAATVCLETKAPTIAAMLPQLGLLTSAVGVSTNDSCSKFATGMKILQSGLAAYSAACSAMKTGCGYSCVQARKGLEGIKAALSKVPVVTCVNPQLPCQSAQFNAGFGKVNPSVEKELAKNDNKSTAGKENLCAAKYAQLVAAAGAGILSAANSFKQAKKCDEDTSADGNSTAQTLDQKCAIAANAQLQECLCYKNPLLPGCDSSGKSTMSAGGMSAGKTEFGVGNTKGKGLSGADIADSSLGGPGGSGKSADSAGGPPPPSGGGSAGIGGGGGGSGSGRDPAGDGSGQKGLNTNILSGAGGGGGGGSWGSGGGSDSGKGYRSYLPGGDKDPNKMAGQQSWVKEVTGQGGKSNWEKIKERYRDNKGTLLSN